MIKYRTVTRCLPAVWPGVLLGILLLGCNEEGLESPTSTPGRLSIELSWESPGQARGNEGQATPARAAVPSIDRIDLQVHRWVGSSEITLAEDSATIDPQQTTFHLEVAVPEGAETSVEIAAHGAIIGESETPETGQIYFGRTDGLTVTADQETQATITLRRYYPSGLTAEGTVADGYRLSWRAVPGAERYRVRRFLQDGSEADTTLLDTMLVQPTDPSGEITSRLLHRIRAENRYFLGAFSDTIGVAAFSTGIPIPVDFVADGIASDAIRITWDYPFRLPDLFHLERQVASQGSWEASRVLPGTATEFVDQEVARATTYLYRIRAQVGDQFSAYAGPDTATTWLDPPLAPTLSEVEQGIVHLVWDYSLPDPTEFGIWKRDVTNQEEIARSFMVAGSERTFDDTAVIATHTYEYAIDVVDNGVTSGVSEATQITLASVVIEAPSDLLATAAGAAVIELTWRDLADNESNFIVDRKIDGEPAFAPIDTIEANRESYTDTGLASRTTYVYQVRGWSQSEGITSSPSISASDRTWPPPIPLVVVAAISADSLRIDWLYSAVRPELFFLERRISGQSAWTELDGVDGTLSRIFDFPLAPRTTYLYRMRAFEEGDYSVYSEVDSAGTRPEPPSGLSAIETAEGNVTLSWSYPIPDPALFEVWRIDVATQGNPELIGTADGVERTYLDDSSVAGATYDYSLLAEDTVYGRSKRSSKVRINLEGPGSPTAPSAAGATATGTATILLTWTDNSDDETQFVVERMSEGEAVFSPIATLPANTESHLDDGLPPRTTQTYRVIAGNDAGDSSPSNEASDRTWPPAPSGLDAEGANIDDLEVSWSFPSPDPDLFQIETRPNGGETWTVQASLPGVSRSTLLTELLPRTVYDIRARAEEGGDASPYSETIVGMTPPPPPTGFIATYSDGPPRVELSWNYDEPLDPNHFRLERSLLGGEWTVIAPDIPSDLRAETDRGVAYDQTYAYRLRAVDLFADGADSVASDYAYVEVATPMWPPGNPGHLTATLDSVGMIHLEWAGSSGQVDQYEIYRRRMQDDSFASSYSVGGSSTEYTDISVWPARTYAYMVRAVNTAGSSTFSNVASETTKGWRPIQVQTAAPSTRRGHCGTWIADEAQVLLYGGGDTLDDLWEYNPGDSTWTEIFYDGFVPSRKGASAAYDPVNRTLFVEGGVETPTAYAGYQFSLDANLWSAICVGTGNQFLGKTGTGTAWISTTGSFYSYGGYSTDGVNEEWYTSMRGYSIPSSCQWISALNLPPSARRGHALHAYSSSNLLLFGGRDASSMYNDFYTGFVSMGDVSWDLMAGGASGEVPSPRHEMDTVYDGTAGRFYVLGGYDNFDGGPKNDLYMFQFADPGSWTRLDAGGTAGVTDPDATEGLLVVDPSTGYLYHVGPGATDLDVWLYVP